MKGDTSHAVEVLRDECRMTWAHRASLSAIRRDDPGRGGWRRQLRCNQLARIRSCIAAIRVLAAKPAREAMIAVAETAYIAGQGDGYVGILRHADVAAEEIVDEYDRPRDDTPSTEPTEGKQWRNQR